MISSKNLSYVLVSKKWGKEVYRESVEISSTTVEDVFVLGAKKARALGAMALKAVNTPKGVMIKDDTGFTGVEVSIIGLFLYNGNETEPVYFYEA